ncbi:MAG: diguanylate cyclase [Erysipelotrichaceae bacterium]|nr:diguanylate cyclase [Erysipelotrichaceae bacterium]
MALKDHLSSSIISTKKARNKSFKITLVYFILGSLWIIFSDRLMDLLFTNHEGFILASLIKGIFYVVVTTIILYLLIYYAFVSVFESEKKAKDKNKELEESIDEYHKLYVQNEFKQLLIESLMNAIEDWIFYTDRDHQIIGANTAFTNFFNIDEEKLLKDQPLNKLQSLSDILGNDSNNDVSLKTMRFEKTFHTKNDHKRIFEIICSPYQSNKKDTHGMIYVGRDITERKEQEDRLRYLNHHDVLTGIYNRAYLEEKRDMIDQEENLPISVIICDVDGLKLVNDAFGHTAGDLLLIATAKLLKENSQKTDMIVRTGGDEFCIIMPKTPYQTAEKIQNAIRDHSTHDKANNIENELLSPNISTGCATKSNMETSFADVFKEAEDYMYQSKLLSRKGIHSIFLKYITTTIFEKSNETQEHCQRMSNMARKMGEQLKLNNRELDTLELAASLHDIGKISIDLSILQKPEKLTNEEWEIMKKHPETGWRIAQAVPDLYQISDIILHHHERWDGKGYPHGLAGNDIPLMSRIITLVDSFDAMTQDRPYQKGISTEKAIIEIQNNAGQQFDPHLSKIFVEQIL